MTAQLTNRRVVRQSGMARNKKPLNMAIDPALLGRLKAWIEKQTVPPSMTAVIEAALRDWLDRQEGKSRK